MFAVAHRLGRTIQDVAEMPYDEFVHWIAYFELITPKKKA